MSQSWFHVSLSLSHTCNSVGSPLWLIPNSSSYESMENSDHIPALSFLSFLVIFTHFHFTLFKPFFHLLYITFSFCWRPLFSPSSSLHHISSVCAPVFQACVGQDSWVTVQPHLIPLTVTIHILYFEDYAGELDSLTLSHWNKLHTSKCCKMHPDAVRSYIQILFMSKTVLK